MGACSSALAADPWEWAVATGNVTFEWAEDAAGASVKFQQHC